MAIRVLITDDVQEMREMIEKMLLMSELDIEVVAMCSNGQETIDRIKKSQVDIVLMDINMPIMNGLEATQYICDHFPHVRVIMMSVQHESEYLKKAMLAGAKAYIMKPVNMDELIETIKTTYERYQHHEKPREQETQKHTAKVVTFFSGKGGVGKSILALNTSQMLNEKFSKKVLLMDLDLQFGDIALMVNKQSELTLKELYDDNSVKSYEDVSPYIYKFKQGYDMLFAPKDPESAEYINKDQIIETISLLKKHYDYIVIDTGVNYDEITLSALDLADLVLLVTNMEVTGLKNTKLSLKVMQSLNYDQSKVKVVVNLMNEKFGVTKGNLQKAFAYDIWGYFPEDIKLIRNAINMGTMLSAVKNHSLLKPLQTLCENIMK